MKATKESDAEDQDTEPEKKPRPPSGHRRLSAKSLYCSRKRRDRRRSNRLVVHQDVRALDAKTLRIPAVGDVSLREALPDGFNVKSVTLIERTPPGRGRNIRPEDRTWKVHLATRVAAPLKPLPDTPSTVGIDFGGVHALTVSRSDGTSEHIHYDEPTAEEVRRFDKFEKQKKKCRGGRRRSRKHRALQRRQNRIRQAVLGRRANQRLRWANRLAKRHDLVGVEHLQNANMRRSARGTNEAPGANVAAKTGLNKKMAAATPGYLAAAIRNACIRHGTRYRMVPAAGTSQTCAVDGYKDPKNRESQAVFLCLVCLHTANADVNAAENMRLLAEAYTGVGVSRPWANRKVTRIAEAARRKAKRAKGASAAKRSTTPDTRRRLRLKHKSQGTGVRRKLCADYGVLYAFSDREHERQTAADGKSGGAVPRRVDQRT